MTIVLLAFALGVLVPTAYAAWRGAPWLPTPLPAIEAGLDAAGVGPGDVLVDLGAGDGRVLRAAARRGARAVGYELSPFFWAVAWLRTRLRSSRSFGGQARLRPASRGGLGGQARVIFADGFRADLRQATVIFSFLRPATMPRLAATLNSQQETRNTRVIVYAFPLPGREPSRVLRIAGCAPIYLYAGQATSGSL